MPQFKFDVRYSEAQIRRSVWAYVRISLRRVMKWPNGILFGGAVVGLIAFAIAGWASPWWWFGPIAIVTVAATLGLMWRAYLSNSLDRLAHMKSPVAHCMADEDNFTVSSDLGTTTMPWHTLTEAIDGPGVLYLKAGKGTLMMLPVEGVDQSALEFVRNRVVKSSRA